MAMCPIDSHHYVPSTKLRDHISSCVARNSPIMTTQEKLKTYEKALQCDAPLTVQVDKNFVSAGVSKRKSETVDLMEELRKQRDAKRRRISYRKKGTHTARKSRTEVFN